MSSHFGNILDGVSLRTLSSVDSERFSCYMMDELYLTWLGPEITARRDCVLDFRQRLHALLAAFGIDYS